VWPLEQRRSELSARVHYSGVVVTDQGEELEQTLPGTVPVLARSGPNDSEQTIEGPLYLTLRQIDIHNSPQFLQTNLA